MSDLWLVQVFGDPNGEAWEISVIHKDNEHGRKSWGWFGDDKLLISHNGGPCHWPMAPGIGPLMVEVAKRYAELKNSGMVMPTLRLEALAPPVGEKDK